MVELKKLKNDPENRQVRDVIMCSGETINVYEPTLDQIEEILSFQEQWVNGADLEISDVDVVKIMFPLLTDIQGIDDLSDDEISEIIENPNIAMLQAKNEVETIVTEVYKTVILSSRKALLDADLQAEAYKVAGETFDRGLALGAKNGVATDKLVSFTKAQDELIAQKEKKDQENIAELDRMNEDTKKDIDKYKDMLAEYQQSFNEAKDEDLIKK